LSETPGDDQLAEIVNNHTNFLRSHSRNQIESFIRGSGVLSIVELDKKTLDDDLVPEDGVVTVDTQVLLYVMQLCREVVKVRDRLDSLEEILKKENS